MHKYAFFFLNMQYRKLHNFFMFLKEVSYAHQNLIYSIKNTVKKNNIVKYLNLKWLFYF